MLCITSLLLLFLCQLICSLLEIDFMSHYDISNKTWAVINKLPSYMSYQNGKDVLRLHKVYTWF